MQGAKHCLSAPEPAVVEKPDGQRHWKEAPLPTAMKFGLHCVQGTPGAVTTPPSEHEHRALAVALHALAWTRPAPQLVQFEQGATPSALHVEPATQGGAGTHASETASHMNIAVHAHCDWPVSVLLESYAAPVGQTEQVAEPALEK